MQRNTWGPTEAEIGDPVGGERGEGNVGDTGGSLRWQGLNRRCQLFSPQFCYTLGQNGGLYDDSLNWVKFKDKELLISNEVEYLSV